jgi:hypothetical protein
VRVQATRFVRFRVHRELELGNYRFGCRFRATVKRLPLDAHATGLPSRARASERIHETRPRRTPRRCRDATSLGTHAKRVRTL